MSVACSHRRYAGTLAVAAALVLTACGGPSTSPASVPPASVPAATASASSSPSPPQTTTASPGGTPGTAGTRIQIGALATLVVPAGWTYRIGASQTANIDAPVSFACLDDPRVHLEGVTSCDVRIQWGPHIAGSEGGEWTSGQRGGYYTATDVQPCPLPGSSTDSSSATFGIREPLGDIPTKSFAPIGSPRHTAELWTYHATCTSGERFTPRIWWLPESRLFVGDLIGNAATQRILDSVRFE